MPVDIKICGLTRLDDANAALDAGADYIGFILFAGSVRAITAPAMRKVLDALHRPARAVAVFVNTPRAEVERVALDCGLHAVQIHGDEPAADFAGFPGVVWRAVRVGAGRCAPSPDAWPAARYVVDAAVPGAYGGTGVTADWKLASELAARHPIALAGGLTPENVALAIRTVRPLAVDVAGGVEFAPGRKDRGRMLAFVEQVRSALL
jgi:phosphoribosylanthranilate isomerase